MGLGLFKLTQLVKGFRGQLWLASGDAALVLAPGRENDLIDYSAEKSMAGSCPIACRFKAREIRRVGAEIEAADKDIELIMQVLGVTAAEITIKLTGPDLASRKTAAVERNKLLAQVSAGIDKAVVDLSDVESVSYSYADEFFGVLAAVKGWEWLSRTVQIAGANEHVLRVIAEVVNRRLKETGQPLRRSA